MLVTITIYNSIRYNYLMPLSLSPKAQLKISFDHATVTGFASFYFIIKGLHSLGKEEPDIKWSKNKNFSNMNNYHKENLQFCNQNRGWGKYFCGEMLKITKVR